MTWTTKPKFDARAVARAMCEAAEQRRQAAEAVPEAPTFQERVARGQDQARPALRDLARAGPDRGLVASCDAGSGWLSDRVCGYGVSR